MTDTVRYVGDPFVDAGVAVLEHRLGKPCTNFALTDLIAQGQWIEGEYARKIWAGYLTLHFPNSGWCNFNMSTTNKALFRRQVLCGFDLPPIGRQCSYCGRPAQILADRSKIPLLTGATNMVAGPGGNPGLPVCAYCIFAVQFYPLATLKVQGKPLFWWSADSRWLFYLTGAFLHTVSEVLAASPDALPSLKWPSTQLLNASWKVLNRLLDSDETLPLADLVGCHATNYGSEPDYQQFPVPRLLLQFWAEARALDIYHEIVEHNWQSPQPRRKAAAQQELPAWTRRNALYEDLGDLIRGEADQQRTIGFAQRYFMNLHSPVKPGQFDLTKLFLETMTNMTKERLGAIERLADRIADSKRCKDWVERLFSARNILSALVDIQDRLLRSKESPLPTSDVWLAFNIVSDEDETARDQFFVRDLMLLKILERGGESALPEAIQEK